MEAGTPCSLGSHNPVSAGEASRGPVGLSQRDGQQEGIGQGLTARAQVPSVCEKRAP